MSEAAWAEAWVKAWAEMPAIGQGSTVDTGKFKYTYASLADILHAVQPVLTANGFAIGQEVVEAIDGRVGIITHIAHKDGFIMEYGPLPMPVSNDPKAVGSAITYGRRYALAAALGIATEEDTDAAGTEPAKPARQKIDHHDRAWQIAIELFEHDDQAPNFLAAINEAGVEKGKKANKGQADKAIELMKEKAT